METIISYYRAVRNWLRPSDSQVNELNEIDLKILLNIFMLIV